MGCFINAFFWIAACIILAIWSEAPPAPAATTISTGLEGSHATAGTAVSASKASGLHLPNVMTPPKKSPACIRGCRKQWAALGRLALGRPRALRKVIERGEHAALLVRHAGERKPHFNPGERAGERQIVEVAEVPDPENLPGEFSQARAQPHLVGFDNDLAQRVGVVAGGHHYRGERARIKLGQSAQDFQPPGTHRAA